MSCDGPQGGPGGRPRGVLRIAAVEAFTEAARTGQALTWRDVGELLQARTQQGHGADVRPEVPAGV